MRIFITPLFLVAICLAVSACSAGGKDNGDTGLSGEELARIHCGSCHAFVEPSQLGKKTWREGVLPQMALRLGVQDSIVVRLGMQQSLDMKMLGIQPARPLLDSAEWVRIVEYYMREAPDSLLMPAPSPLRELPAGQFSRKSIDLGLEGGPLTTLLHWEESERLLYAGEGGNNLFRFRDDGSLKDVFGFSSPPVAVEKDEKGGTYILTIGHVKPNDEPRGELHYLDAEGRLSTVLDNLPRPVAMARADLDGDGIADLVICGFGHYTGRFSWWKGLGEQRFEENLLLPMPGAVSTWIRDLNRDGHPDILTLMAQGDERIIVHYNRGGGNFEMETLLRFNPAMGSSYMEPADMDGDGDLDLVYANGDNADFSFSLKPYHGIRIFENDGQQGFREAYFYPLPGATKAIPFDLNGDDLPDLAAIAFFPDFPRDSTRSFVVLEQQPHTEGLQFGSATLPAMQVGRWLTLDSGDFNADGKADLALGSFTYSPTPTPTDLYLNWMASRDDVLLLLTR